MTRQTRIFQTGSLCAVLLFSVSMAWAACALAGAKPKYPYNGYEGPERPDSTIAILHLREAGWVRTNSVELKLGRHDAVKVLPGRMYIEWGGTQPGGVFGHKVSLSDTVLLEPGHVYSAYVDYEHPFGGSYQYFGWIEDANAGLVVAGAKKPSRMTAAQRKTAGATSELQARIFGACVDGDVAAVSDVLDGGFEVDSRSKGGWTPLMVAAKAGQLEVMRLLIDRGADVNAQDDYEQTALMQASVVDPTAVTLLLDGGADPNLKMAAPYGSTALMVASGEEKPDELNVECVRRLLSDPDTDVNASGAEGQTALMYAALTKAYVTAQLLLDHGAEINAVDEHGKTALDWAKGGKMKKLLKEAGAKRGKDL